MVRDPILIVRWGLTTTLAYLVLLGAQETPSPTTLGYLVCLLASNIAVERVWERSRGQRLPLLLGVDTAFVVVGILGSAAGTGLLVAYLACAATAALANNHRRLALLATACTALYGLWTLTVGNGSGSSATLAQLPFLFIATIFYGVLLQRLRSERVGREDAESRAGELETLLEVTRALASTRHTSEVLDSVAAIISRGLGGRSCRIHLVQDGITGIEEASIEALRTGSPVVGSKAHERTARSVLVVPIVHGSEALGTLIVEGDGQKPATEDEIELCQVIANAAAAALDNARQYEQLLEAERCKSEFLKNLSHEMRTPLQVLTGYAEIAEGLREDEDSTSMTGEILGNISTAAAQMQEHVENLLRLSRAALGHERVRVEPVDIAKLVDDSLLAVRPMIRGKAIELQAKVAAEGILVQSDPERLGRVLRNVLINAVKFTETGTITVHASLSKSSAADPTGCILSLAIEDTGMGVPEGSHSRIFDDFHQVDGSDTRSHEGLGLGLAVVRRLVDSLGGEVRVAQSSGAGSRFEIDVPVRPCVPVRETNPLRSVAAFRV